MGILPMKISVGYIKNPMNRCILLKWQCSKYSLLHYSESYYLPVSKSIWVWWKCNFQILCRIITFLNIYNSPQVGLKNKLYNDVPHHMLWCWTENNKFIFKIQEWKNYIIYYFHKIRVRTLTISPKLLSVTFAYGNIYRVGILIFDIDKC